ncbi:phosphatidate cytidylyltransferase [Proteinivorax tanatarense]|uniref:Phosphatidate cytidylyltransferase n=1 Tax=Proteinivorax tanatarense TaxID=1260629 RepID=A0AAU7VQP4_9FIRM
MFKRIGTAILGIPLILIIIWLGGLPLSASLLLLGMIATSEYTKMLNLPKFKVGIPIAFFGFCLFFSSIPFHIIFFVYFFIIAVYLLIVNFHSEEINTLAYSLIPIPYIFLPFWLLGAIRQQENGFIFLLIILVIPWITDTGAYFVGLSVGKNKLLPSVSPKKTIEGALGGLFLCILFLVSANYYLDILAFHEAFLFAFVGSILAQIGDLFESALKRKCNIKDSGDILPGHGGILDRFDSLLFIAPFGYIFFKYFI